MPEIVLHHVPQSRSMRILWLLHELGAPFTLREHQIGPALRDPGYLELSPAGRVPALEIGGARMFESGAIAEYLCECFPEKGLGRAPGDPERMGWLMWMHFAETVSQHAAALTQQHIMLFEDSMRSPVITKIEAKRLGKCYEAIEAELAAHAGSERSLLPSGFSAADICVGQAVYMARHFAGIKPFPQLKAWYADITARPAFRASLPGPKEARLYKEEFYPPIPA